MVEEVQKDQEKSAHKMVSISYGNFINTRYYYERFTNNFFLVFQIITLSVLLAVRKRSIGMMGNQMQTNELKDKIFEMQKDMGTRFKDVAGHKECK